MTALRLGLVGQLLAFAAAHRPQAAVSVSGDGSLSELHDEFVHTGKAKHEHHEGHHHQFHHNHHQHPIKSHHPVQRIGQHHHSGLHALTEQKAQAKAKTPSDGEGTLVGQETAEGLGSNHVAFSAGSTEDGMSKKLASMLKLLEQFQLAPWGPKEWNQQSIYINQLRNMQTSAQTEAASLEADAAQQLIMAVVSKQPYFHESAAAVEQATNDLATQIQMMNNDMLATSLSFNRSTEAISESLDDLLLHDNEVIQGMKVRMDEEFKALTLEIEATSAEVERKKAGLVDDITADQERGEQKLALLKNRIKASEEMTDAEIERLTAKHDMNKQKVSDASKEFEKYWSEVSKTIDAVPNTMTSKMDQLETAMESEQTTREDQIKELEQESSDVGEELSEEILTLTTALKKDFDDTKEQADDVQKQHVDMLNQDVLDFESEAEDSVKTMADDAAETQTTLGLDAENLGSLLDTVRDKLLDTASIQKEFPRQAEADLATIEEDARTKFNEVREWRAEKQQEKMQEFDRAISDAETAAAEDIDNKVQNLLSKGKESVSGAVDRSENLADAATEQLEGLVDDVDTVNDDVSSLRSEQKTVDTRLDTLDEQVSTAYQTVSDRVEAKDKAIMNDARSTASDAKAEIDEDKSKIAAAENDGVKQLSDAEKSLKASFEKKDEELQDHIRSGLNEADQNLERMDDMSHQLRRTLTGKVDQIQTQTDLVIGTENTQGKLQEIEGNAQSFMNDANSAIANVQSNSDEAISKAEEYINGHMLTLKTAADDAYNGVVAATNPLLTSQEAAAKSASDDLTDTVGALAKVADDSINNGVNQVNIAEKSNAENEAQVLQLSDQTQPKIDASQQKIDQAKNTLDSDVEQQQAQLKTAESAMDGLIASEQQKVSTTAETELETAQSKMNGYVTKADDEVKEAQGSLTKDVNEAVDQTSQAAEQLQPATTTLKGILKEAELALKSTEQGVAQESKDLSDSVTASRKADSEAQKKLKAQMKDGAAKVKAGAQSAFGAAEAADDQDFKKAAKQAEGYAESAEEESANAGNILSETIDAFKEGATKEAKDVGSSVSALSQEVAKAELTEEQKQAQLQNEFNKITAQAQKAGQDFTNELAKSKAMLATMAGDDQQAIMELSNAIEQLETHATKAVDDQAGIDQGFLDKLVEDAKKAATTVESKVQNTQEEVDTFSAKLASVDKDANKALKEAQDLAQGFDEKLRLTSRRFIEHMEDEKRARKNATQWLMAETKNNMGKLGAVMDMIVQLEMKVTAQVKYQLGTLKLDEESLERKLGEAQHLEQYQEEGAIDKVLAKLEATREREGKIYAWKNMAEKSAKDFQGAVQNMFKSMGEDLDLAALDVAEQKATEQWAIQNSQAHLKGVLGAEMADLSATSQARLRALAEKSGADIARLMANFKGTEEERAAEIQKIKDNLAAQAKRILEENGRIELDQQTAARNIKVETQTVTDSMNTIASLEGGAAPPAGLSAVLDRVRKMISDAAAHMDNHAATMDDSTAQQAQDVPEVQIPEALKIDMTGGQDKESSLLESGEDLASLVAAAEQSSEEAIAEDAAWKRRLDKLLA